MGEDDFLWRPSVIHLIRWQDIRGKTWNIQYIIEIVVIKINPTLPQTISNRVISQNNFWTFWIIKRGESPFVETMCLEATKSMMKVDDLEVLETMACTLSLSFEFDPPSLFFACSIREMLFCYKIWVNMCTYSFHLCSSSFGNSSWRLRAPLETLTCLSFS